MTFSFCKLKADDPIVPKLLDTSEVRLRVLFFETVFDLILNKIAGMFTIGRKKSRSQQRKPLHGHFSTDRRPSN